MVLEAVLVVNFSRNSWEPSGSYWGGCGSAVISAGFPQLGIGFLGVALAFGLTVLTAAYAFGPVSGGHFNPAVSLGLAAAGRFSWKELGPYWVAQIPGAIFAAFILLLVTGMRGRLGHKRSLKERETP